MTVVGELARVVEGSIATAWSFRHAPGRHRDPLEEWLPSPTVILTAAGSWSVASRTVRGTASPDAAVVAGGSTAYRCRHEAAQPADRTLAVTFGPRLGLLTAGVPPVVEPGALALVPLVGPLGEARRRLVAATHAAGPHAPLALDLAAVDFLLAARTAVTPDAGPVGGRIGHVLARMRADPDASFDLGQLAALAGLSVFHFARAFRAAVGEPPVAHLRRLRLERAAERLRSGDGSITTIAHDAGYRDAAHFATAFRRQFGRTPSEVRHAGHSGTRRDPEGVRAARST